MREDVMTALFALLTAPPLVMPFTATVTAGDVNVHNVTLPPGGSLILNMPVTGQGVAEGSVIANLDPVQLSLPAITTTPVAELTQGFQTTGRRLQFWSNVKEQPALFLVDSDEEWHEHPPTKPAIVTLETEVWLYSSAGENPDIVPAIALNEMIEAIDAQLLPSTVTASGQIRFTIPQTLGVLGVIWLGIEGRIQKTPGHIGGQGIAVIPVKIVITQAQR